jgi:hypothetical protein
MSSSAIPSAYASVSVEKRPELMYSGSMYLMTKVPVVISKTRRDHKYTVTSMYPGVPTSLVVEQCVAPPSSSVACLASPMSPSFALSSCVEEDVGYGCGYGCGSGCGSGCGYGCGYTWSRRMLVGLTSRCSTTPFPCT